MRFGIDAGSARAAVSDAAAGLDSVRPRGPAGGDGVVARLALPTAIVDH